MLAKPFSERPTARLTSKADGRAAGQPRDRVAYPTGSTFKPVTAFAALEAGLIKPGTTIDDPGTGSSARRSTRTRGDASFGTINVSDALKVSSDIFFFQLGAGPTSTAT